MAISLATSRSAKGSNGVKDSSSAHASPVGCRLEKLDILEEEQLGTERVEWSCAWKSCCWCCSRRSSKSKFFSLNKINVG